MTKSDGFSISEIPNLDGYVAIVTGGNSGIGYETTVQLARHGARVYIASRSHERVKEAISKMRQTHGSLDLHFLALDLQDLQSVKATAAEFVQKESRLDILINNAGIMACPYKLTKDGYESQWQTCFLGHHAFTMFLLPLLQSTAQQSSSNAGRVRIINVASDAAFLMGPKQINYKDPNMTDSSGAMAAWKRYGHSKQASIIAAKAINEYYNAQGITAYSLHPGIVKSNLQSYDTSFLGTMTRVAMKVVPTASALDGARTSLYCATSPQALKEAGHYFVPFGKVDHRADKWLNDPDSVKKLWELANSQLKKSGFALEL